MPFKSRAQMRACYAQTSKKSSKTSTWNCDEWLQATPDPGCLPKRVGMPRPRPCKSKERSQTSRGKLHTGPRGGKYYLIGGGKVYV